MHGMQAAILTLVLDFLKSMLSEFAKNQLRAKTSLEIARDLSYDLVGSLNQLQHSSELFAAYLAEAADDPQALDATLRAKIDGTVQAVSEALVLLAENMNKIDPQLEVHAPEVAEKIYHASQSRNRVLSEVQDLLESASGIDSSKLHQLSQEADRVQGEINVASEKLRKFIAKSIGYTDSFGTGPWKRPEPPQ